MTGVTDVVKIGIKLMSNIGIGTVVGAIGRSYIPEAAGTLKNACVLIGSMGVAGVVGSATDEYFDKAFNDIESVINNVKTNFDNKKNKNITIEIDEEVIEEA